MKIAVIGSGGREHAVAWKFAQTEGWENVFTLPGNGGTPNSHDIDVSDFATLQTFCEKKEIELIFVGPEAPLAAGIVDFFIANSKIKIFGPDKHATQLESSKSFAKDFMRKHGVATASSKKFTSPADAMDHIMQHGSQVVIKYDGLAAGKGVYVCENRREVELALADLNEKYGNEFPFLVEEKLIGDEISMIGFTNGEFIQLLPTAQDHKQLLENDKGPNTGGMGAISPVPYVSKAVTDEIRTQIINPTIKGLKEEGFNFKGTLFFGIMVTEKGPKLLEYNVRLGDPETEILLPSLKTSLTDLVLQCLEGNLEKMALQFEEGYFVDIVIVSEGYPKSYHKGKPIKGLDKMDDNTLVFHAGTRKEDNQILTNGGRVLNVVTHAKTLEKAIEKAYQECAKIDFENHFYRKDIGQRTYTVLAK